MPKPFIRYFQQDLTPICFSPIPSPLPCVPHDPPISSSLIWPNLYFFETYKALRYLLHNFPAPCYFPLGSSLSHSTLFWKPSIYVLPSVWQIKFQLFVYKLRTYEAISRNIRLSGVSIVDRLHRAFKLQCRILHRHWVCDVKNTVYKIIHITFMLC
jgi:hypothetical protein